MPKTPLRSSPLAVLGQEFIQLSLEASLNSEHGAGNLAVDREIKPLDNHPRGWLVVVRVRLEALEDEAPPPPYTGRIVMRGFFEVAEDYPDDPERLVRVTAASMLYGAIRESVSNFTARSANGMVTLPSVSFYEKTPTAKKRAAKKALRT